MSCRRGVGRSPVRLFQPTMPVDWRKPPSIAGLQMLISYPHSGTSPNGLSLHKPCFGAPSSAPSFAQLHWG